MKKVLVFLLIIGISFISGCSKEKLFDDNMVNKNIKKLISDDIPYKYVNDLRYSNNDIKDIISISNKYGIKNPYVPSKGISTDYLMEIREEKDSIALIYPHFSIRQSLKNIFENINIIEENTVKLNIGEAKWVRLENNAPLLYIKLNNINITISTAKSFEKEEFEDVIESLMPLLN